MIKLIASDVDGTLMREGERVIPPALFPLIHTMKENGIYFAACSGRQYAKRSAISVKTAAWLSGRTK